MKQTLALSPSSDPLGLAAWHSGSPIVVTGTVPSYPTMRSWYMQLWKYPHHAFEAGAEPVATAVGGVTSGAVTFTFTSAQTAISGLSDVIGTNNYFLTVGGIDSAAQPHVCRAGVIEIARVPFLTSEEVIPTGIIVSDDVASFEYDGTTYTLPVAPMDTAPEGAVEGELVVIDDVLVITFNGISYSVPVAPDLEE